MRQLPAASAPDSPPLAALPPLATRDDSAYWDFQRCLTERQVQAWSPPLPARVLDLSGCPAELSAGLLAAGHTVLQARSPGPAIVGPAAGASAGRLPPVVVGGDSLSWLADASVSGVLAESRALPLATRTAARLADVRRVLRPAGSLLLVVESLVQGLSLLAEQQDWAALADVPRGGPLVLTDDLGRATRYFRSAELRGLLVAAGFEVDWVRPSTVLTPSAVKRAVEQGVALETLVQTELQLAQQQDADAGGLHLLACARRPATD